MAYLQVECLFCFFVLGCTAMSFLFLNQFLKSFQKKTKVWSFFRDEILSGNGEELQAEQLENLLRTTITKGFQDELITFWLCTAIGRQIVQASLSDGQFTMKKKQQFLIASSLDPLSYNDLVEAKTIGTEIQVS